MAKDKLNKIASMYSAASAIGDKGVSSKDTDVSDIQDAKEEERTEERKKSGVETGLEPAARGSLKALKNQK